MKWLLWLPTAAICIAFWLPTNAHAQSDAQPIAWRIEDKIDKLDGDRVITFFVSSTDTLEINGRSTAPAVLAIRCRNRKTDISIQWPAYFTLPGNFVSLRWRIDDGEIVSEQWPSEARSRLTHSQGLQYVRKFLGKQKLVFSVNASQPQTLTFPIGGLDLARPMMSVMCDW